MDKMMYLISVINIIAILLSPLIASIITSRLASNYERRREKIEILQILMRTRLNRSCIDFVNALNTIDIVFYDSKKVRAAYKELLEMYRLGCTDIEEHNIKNLKLIESIVQDVGYSKNINWDEISLPYNPKWFYDELDKQEKFKGIQLMMGDAISKYLNSASINETKGNQ